MARSTRELWTRLERWNERASCFWINKASCNVKQWFEWIKFCENHSIFRSKKVSTLCQVYFVDKKSLIPLQRPSIWKCLSSLFRIRFRLISPLKSKVDLSYEQRPKSIVWTRKWVPRTKILTRMKHQIFKEKLRLLFLYILDLVDEITNLYFLVKDF
jgi:hypothetical protein